MDALTAVKKSPHGIQENYCPEDVVHEIREGDSDGLDLRKTSLWSRGAALAVFGSST
jgi:hypothetical protein